MDSKAVLFLSRYHATFREPVRLGRMGKHQTHLCVIGRIRLVIGVGEAHPSWGLEVQHVGNLERRRWRKRVEGSPPCPSAHTPPQDPQHRPYQVPRIGVVLQGNAIWLDLRRKKMAEWKERASVSSPWYR